MVTVELPSPVSGALSEQRFKVGETVKVGDILGKVADGAAGKAAAAPEPVAQPDAVAQPKAAAAPAPVAAAAPATSTAPAPAPAIDKDALLDLPPSQRKLARERGSLPRAETRQPSSPVPSGPVDPRDEVVPMSPLRKRIAERLVQAQQESASLTTFNEVDMSAIMNLRNSYKETFEKQHGVKLGFMSFFVRACVAACKLYPGINAEVRGDAIVYKKHYDFGVAVSTPRGLVVPVLRACETLSFAGIEKGILLLAEKARSGKLAIEDLLGGTFTITNGGIYGSMMSTPLLNYPQTGILGMHNIVKRAMVIDDQVQVRPMMYLAVTYDHRVVDGKEAVSFLVAVKDRLEAPDRLLLEV
jgi:2-oxoglutarate dehydrogenase E2 component (dihydrolipoamide succinyltransferase)